MVKSGFTSLNACPCGETKAYNSTIDMAGGLMVLARVFPSEEHDFAQILLPVALSYETFLCKMCVALGVDKDTVKKVVRLPDILIRSTEDVCRLEPYVKLEVRIKKKNPLRKGLQTTMEMVKKCGPSLLISIAFLMLMAVIINQQLVRSEIHSLTMQIKNMKSSGFASDSSYIDKKMQYMASEMTELRENLDATVHSIQEMYSAFSKCDFEEVEAEVPDKKVTKDMNKAAQQRHATRRGH